MAGRRRLRRGVVVRIARPFAFLVLVLLLIGGAELSSAIATNFLAAQEAELGRLLNEERVARGLPPLGRADALRTVARRHAQRMMREGTIFHSENLRDEVEAVFPAWASIGENVGVGPSVPSVHRAFMDSPDHRANIVDPDWGWMGIGVVTGGRRLFMTENFLELQAGAERPVPARFRLAGPDRLDTARVIADFGFAPGSADGAVLADARDFHGALAGSALAGAVDGPTVLTERDRLSSAAEDGLRRALGSDPAGKVVYLVGGPFAPDVVEAVRSLGATAVTVGGADHVATAAAVARELPRRPRTAFVSTVERFPDALAASAVSAVTGAPVLYTDPDRLSPGTRAVLDDLGITEVRILGGDAAVSASVDAALRGAGIATSRLAGPDRFATAAAIADFGLARGLEPRGVTLATGLNFPDALAGGALADALRAPVLLTGPGALHGRAADWLARHRDRIDAAYLLGGEDALSSRIDTAVRNVLD